MKYILLGLQLLPAVLGAVKAAEQMITLPKSGSDKLALVTGIVEDVYASVGDEVRKDYAADKVVTLIAGICGRVVALLNKLGIFGGN